MTISWPEQKQGIKKYFIEPAAPPISLLYLGGRCGGGGVGGGGLYQESKSLCGLIRCLKNICWEKLYLSLHIIYWADTVSVIIQKSPTVLTQPDTKPSRYAILTENQM